MSTVTVAELLLTTTQPVSHHDPAVRDESNANLFNRRKKLLARADVPDLVIDDVQIAALCANNPIPVDLKPMFDNLDLAEFATVALTRLFMDMYGANDGTGLFSGMERYTMLQSRLQHAAIRASNLRRFWNDLCNAMLTPVHDSGDDESLLQFFALPMPFQQAMLRIAVHDHGSILAVARYWHSQAKLASERYAEAVGKPMIEMVTAEPQGLPKQMNRAVVEMPEVSGNTLRHQAVRKPGWIHLCQVLGIEQSTLPGGGILPPGVEAIFVNGGNIRKGAKQPGDPYGLAWQIRDAFPLLDLLGGVTDSFDLGESRLKVSAWLLCAENREYLQDSPACLLPACEVSVYDLLDDVTETRQASPRGVGQMIRNFETLCAGTQMVLRLVLEPFTPQLTQGALAAAVQTYLEGCPVIGGQSARGYGHLQGQWLVEMPGADGARALYDEYLGEHRAGLLEAMTDGTMGTNQRVLS